MAPTAPTRGPLDRGADRHAETLGRVIQTWMTRNQLFAGLFILGFANGAALDVMRSVRDLGWLESVSSALGISAIVWVAIASGVVLLLRSVEEPISGPDGKAAVVILLLVAAPFSGMSWVGLTALGLYVYAVSEPGTARRRGSLILLALTVPMFWSKLLFMLVARPILAADAIAAAALLGTERIGNVVAFPDGSGYFQVYAGCSSLANMSLAFLAWVTVTQLIGRRWSASDLTWYVAACLAVVSVNIIRIALIGLYPQHFEFLHGPFGGAIYSWTTSFVIATICILGVRRELFARA